MNDIEEDAQTLMAKREQQSLRDVLKGNIGVLIWTRLILFLPLGMHYPYFSLFIEALGGSPQAIGIVQSMASLTALIIVPIGGYFADFHGRVKLIASSFYFRSVAFLTYALSVSWSTLAIGRFYQGLTEYNHAAQSAIIADSIRPGRRGVGFAALNTLPTVIMAVAPTLGAYVITQFGLELGMRYLLGIACVSMFFVGFGRQKFLTETLQRENRAEHHALRDGVVRFITRAYRSSWEALKWTPKNLAVFVMMGALVSFSGAMVGPFWIIYATNVINLSVLDWSFILMVEGLVRVVLSIPAGMLVDKVGNKNVIVVMLFVSIFPSLLFTYSQTLVHAMMALLSVTVVTLFLTPACMAWLADMVPRRMRARITSAYGRGYIGVRGGAGGMGSGYVLMAPALLGSVLGGFIYSFNPAYPWFIHTGLLGICLILGILFLKEPETPEI